MNDMMKERKKVIKLIRNRYILAISIIALMLVLSQIIVQYNISSEEDKTSVINIAGRQRMLSQRINKTVLGLYSSEDYKDKVNYLNELTLSLQLWEDSHNALLVGDAKMKLFGNNNQVIQFMFQSIKPQFLNILEAAKTVKELCLNGAKPEEIRPYLNIIKENEVDFLKGMDQIVFQYNKEADEKVVIFKKVEMSLLGIALITLLLEILFIFRPTTVTVAQAIDNLEKSYQDIKNIFQFAPTPLILFSEKEFKILRVNTAAKDFFQKDGKKVEMKKFLANNKEVVSGIFQKITTEGNFKNKEINFKINDYEKTVLLISACKLSFEEQDTILVGFSDITVQKKSAEELYVQATIDEMTKILNKRTGLAMLTEKIINKEQFVVVFIDIDGLKLVNDTFGHQEGDNYIKTVVQKIKESLSANDFLFRYGGDEIVMVVNAEGEINSSQRAEGMLNKINNIIQDEHKPYKMWISYGIAKYDNTSSETAEEILARADAQMYINKRINKDSRNLI